MENLIYLRKLSNDVLISELKELCQQERTLLTKLLHYLKELEIRKLYLEMGYSSLYAYMTEELGYSEGGAQRRIQAMRLIKDIPEVEEKIEKGEISLSVASQVQGFLQRETKKRKQSAPPTSAVKGSTNSPKTLDKQEKLELIKKLEGTSSRTCEKKLAEISPETGIPKEKTRIISSENAVIQFVAHKRLQKKLKRLKELTSHQNPEGKYALLIEKMADNYLEKIDPIQRQQRRVKRGKKISQPTKTAPSPGPVRGPRSWGGHIPNLPLPPSQTTNAQKSPPTSAVGRYISSKLKDQIWVRDKGQCQFKDKQTGKVCDSKHLLELDHRYPFALGGEHSEGNLRLLCRQHKQAGKLGPVGRGKLRDRESATSGRRAREAGSYQAEKILGGVN